MKTVIIDNYDSFTYNLVHYIEEINEERPTVIRNDQFSLDELDEYDCIVLSPGPGIPKEAGLLIKVIERYYKSKVILGVCLGHQAIGEFFGGELENLSRVYHGIDTNMKIFGDQIVYRNKTEIKIGRYHSWVVAETNFPNCLKVTGKDENGQIMSLKHKELPIHGIQYHPESVLTPEGKELLSNFFNHYKTLS